MQLLRKEKGSASCEGGCRSWEASQARSPTRPRSCWRHAKAPTILGSGIFRIWTFIAKAVACDDRCALWFSSLSGRRWGASKGDRRRRRQPREGMRLPLDPLPVRQSDERSTVRDPADPARRLRSNASEPTPRGGRPRVAAAGVLASRSRGPRGERKGGGLGTNPRPPFPPLPLPGCSWEKRVRGRKWGWGQTPVPLSPPPPQRSFSWE